MGAGATRLSCKPVWMTVIALGAFCGQACKVTKHLEVVSANQASATLTMQYEHGYEDYAVHWDAALDEATRRCHAWGHTRPDFSGATVECIVAERVVEQPGAAGCAPSEPTDEEGMGTQAAEDRRSFRGVGTVGSSVCQRTMRVGCARWRVSYTVRCMD